jgi:hypothetical protein
MESGKMALKYRCLIPRTIARVLIATCLLVIPISSLSGCDPAPSTCLVVTPLSGKAGQPPDYDDTDVEGKVTNNCGRGIIDVIVQYRLYDGDGNVVGEADAGTPAGLAPGDSYSFRATGDHLYDHFQLSRIDGN